MPDKKKIIELVITELSKEHQQAIDAANDAHAAAVDDQSVAETQYDTLAIEASYLAEGQSRRVAEFQHAIDAYKSLDIIEFHNESYIALGALVQLSADAKANHWFFIGPAAGGFRCQLGQKNITVITPQSPMGMALIGKQQDDDIQLMLGSNKLKDYISALK